MVDTHQDLASQQVNLLAERNNWPLIADPHLRFLNPRLQTAFDAWHEKSGSRAMPARGDLTLQDLRKALPHLAFLNIVQHGARLRFKVRLAGGALEDFLGCSLTGRFIDEAVPPHFAQKWTAWWQPTISARAPTRTVGRVEYPNRRHFVGEALCAPLADDGETPDILLFAVYFHADNDELTPRLVSELGARASLTA
jgi:hypothetical protein